MASPERTPAEVCDSQHIEDDDFELAMRLQQQEAAMYQIYETRDAAFYYQFDPMMAEESSEDQEAAEEDADVPADAQEDAPHENTDEGDWSEPCSPINVVIADEEFARRLHLEEQSHHRRRLMEMAGLPPAQRPDDSNEEDNDEDDNEEYYNYLTDDSIDPDEMSYEELQALTEAVGVVSRGLTADTIANLSESIYIHPSSKPAAKALQGPVHCGCDEDEQCAICRMEFETGNKVKHLPCKHVFHPGCIDQWLGINKACPICGTEVDSPGQLCEKQELPSEREQSTKL